MRGRGCHIISLYPSFTCLSSPSSTTTTSPYTKPHVLPLPSTPNPNNPPGHCPDCHHVFQSPQLVRTCSLSSFRSFILSRASTKDAIVAVMCMMSGTPVGFVNCWGYDFAVRNSTLAHLASILPRSLPRQAYLSFSYLVFLSLHLFASTVFPICSDS